jgi:hypothetical protein
VSCFWGKTVVKYLWEFFRKSFGIDSEFFLCMEKFCIRCKISIWKHFQNCEEINNKAQKIKIINKKLSHNKSRQKSLLNLKKNQTKCNMSCKTILWLNLRYWISCIDITYRKKMLFNICLATSVWVLKNFILWFLVLFWWDKSLLKLVSLLARWVQHISVIMIAIERWN